MMKNNNLMIAVANPKANILTTYRFRFRLFIHVMVMMCDNNKGRLVSIERPDILDPAL